MQLKITEEVNTIPWSQGVREAPAKLVKLARESSEEGIPTAIGKIKNTITGKEQWCIMQCGQGPDVAYRHEGDETPDPAEQPPPLPTTAPSDPQGG